MPFTYLSRSGWFGDRALVRIVPEIFEWQVALAAILHFSVMCKIYLYSICCVIVVVKLCLLSALTLDVE